MLALMADIRVMFANKLNSSLAHEVKPEDLPDWKSLHAVGCDDLDLRDLVFAIEDEYDVIIPDDITPPEGATVGWLLKSLASRINNYRKQ